MNTPWRFQGFLLAVVLLLVPSANCISVTGKRLFRESSPELLEHFKYFNYEEEAKWCIPNKVKEVKEDEVEDMFYLMQDMRVIPFPKEHRLIRHALEIVDMDDKLHHFFTKIYERMDFITTCIVRRHAFGPLSREERILKAKGLLTTTTKKPRKKVFVGIYDERSMNGDAHNNLLAQQMSAAMQSSRSITA